MKWRRIKVGDLLARKTGTVNPDKSPSERFSLYSIPAFDNGAPEELLGSEIGSSKQILQPGDVLLSKIVPHIRRCWVVGKTLSTHRMIGSGEWIVFRTHRVDAGYLSKVLVGDEFHKAFLQTVAGVGGSLKRARPAAVAEIEIPVPPLDEQRRIAAVLDKADALRRQRQESLQLTEKLLQSVFLSMFGDPVGNPKNLPTDDLENLAKLERGKFTPRPRNDPSYYSGDFPFIQTGDITRSKGRITGWTQTLNEKGIRVSREFQPGTVVIAIVGATLGETAIVETPVYCPDSIIGVTPYPTKATSEFLEFLLRLWKPRLKELAPDAARANLNLERLRPLPALAPELDLQQEFSRIARDLRQLTLDKTENGKLLDKLFSSLQQRAFRGELDLSRLQLGPAAESPIVSPAPQPTVAEGRYTRPGSFIAPADIEKQLLAMEKKLEGEQAEPLPWSEDFFKYRTLSQILQPPFSFAKIWSIVEQDFAEPDYETVKNKVFEYVAAGVLKQEFSEEQREIVLRPGT
ncbi:restriction modification system DNA specificity subunit [Pirellula staleyi DSM 6068]|uniref:Restriction modification system DNA specificity subunit n=1 Tax=Pirellula staleyi (strain ATCC 27377 / DSM 6068 / ICPB 4128) TaxID=530564 RepID=D2R601_PIRSD|nr:restriction endonuclease subunit S [Pirellula staleyi]ADB19086.1 restriction modification system DNA specificity subunit [Pirellula staleyi DSM 6068]